MKAHGVPWLIRHLDGEISLDEAAAGAIMDTRRYAKRQLTWFRNQMKDWPWAAAEEAEKALESQLRGGLGSKRRLTGRRDVPINRAMKVRADTMLRNIITLVVEVRTPPRRP